MMTKCFRRKVLSSKLPASLRSMTRMKEFALSLVSDDAKIEPHDFFWSGGSRNVYQALDLKSGVWRQPHLPSSPFSAEPILPIEFATDADGKPVEVVVVSGTFLGKPARLHVYVPESLALRFAGVESALARVRKSYGLTDVDLPLAHLRDWLSIDCLDAEAQNIEATLTTYYGEQH